MLLLPHVLKLLVGSLPPRVLQTSCKSTLPSSGISRTLPPPSMCVLLKHVSNAPWAPTALSFSYMRMASKCAMWFSASLMGATALRLPRN